MYKTITVTAKSVNTDVYMNALKIQKTLSGLSQIDIKLMDWYLTDKPKKGTTVESITKNDLAFFENLIIRKRNKNPDTQEIYLELGSYFSLKSHKTFIKGLGLIFKCCSNYERAKDGVQLHDPFFEKNMDLTAEQIEQVVSLFKEVWQSDRIEVS